MPVATPCSTAQSIHKGPTSTMVPPQSSRIFVTDSGREKEINVLRTQLQAQARELMQLARELATKDEQIMELRRQAANLQDQMTADRTNRAEESMRKELTAIQSEIEEKLKAIESLELATDANRAIADLGGEKSRLQAEITELKLQRQHAEHERRMLEKQLNDSEKSLALDRDQYTRAVRQMKEDHQREVSQLKESYHREIQELKSEAASRVRHVEERITAEAQRREQALRDHCEKLIAKLTELETALNEANAMQAQTHSEVETLRAQCNELRGYGERMQAAMASRDREADEHRTGITEMHRELDRLRHLLKDKASELETTKVELAKKVKGDIDSVVAAAECEHKALLSKLRKADSKVARLKEKLEKAEGLNSRLESEVASLRESHSSELAAALHASRVREDEISASSQAAREALSLRLAETEQDLHAAKAALAEAKTTALMQYFHERHEIERSHTGMDQIFSEEVRSCTRIVRKLLERHTHAVECTESDSKISTLKQLLLQLQSHTTSVLEDPPPPVPGMHAWEESVAAQQVHLQHKKHTKDKDIPRESAIRASTLHGTASSRVAIPTVLQSAVISPSRAPINSSLLPTDHREPSFHRALLSSISSGD
eukprot:Sspe_Gene.76809::Locus_47980_Transcript_1_1_Confidence_1.000_Length_2024::g.76809::m.76809